MKTAQENKSFTLWPYAIVVAIVLFMAYIAMFVYKAMQQDVDLVSKDYYEQEIKYQDQIDKVKRTQALGDVMLDYKADADAILLQMPATYKDKNLTGTITLFRPSDDKMDKELSLQLGRDQSQLLETNDLESGVWKVRVNFSDGEEFYYTEKTVQIK
ncbi:FixH family protein [Pontibacter cellulosilyticus]|uniref:FixH family protein n=1 Tax=Pontibacter cellulosilyticus TaxID=1720253 RepID=A0A923N7G7_9BACT|nr:FixH family protein [Pontibacter cellulosilyticus]MBC5992297.1 FixH family protein [Pontibacter cellulosilyticus]